MEAMDKSVTDWVRLGLEVLTLVGVVPALRRWLGAGRRARTASLVAQLASEVLVAVARRRNVPPAAVVDMEEAIQLLIKRLVASGVDPKRAADIARAALAGAAHSA